MTTSGTVGQTTIDIATIVEKVFRRATGKDPSNMTPDNIKVIEENLYLFLSSLANKGLPMWCITTDYFGLYANQAQYPMPAGTIDIFNANWWNPQRLDGFTWTSSAGGTASYLDDGDIETSDTQTAPDGNFKVDFGADNETPVKLFGYLPNGDHTYNLIVEVSDDDATWLTVRTIEETEAEDREWQWYFLDPSIEARYWRVRETGGATLNFRELYIAEVVQSTPMGRLTRDDYMALSNIGFTASQPLQYWMDRQITPVVNTWPQANSTFQLMQLTYSHEVEDVGDDMTNSIAVPQRWLDAIIWCVAQKSIFELPDVDLKRKMLIDQEAATELAAAQSEERDTAPSSLVPNISGYTA